MTANASAYLDLTPVAFMRRPPDHRLVLTVIVASALAVDLLHARPLPVEPASASVAITSAASPSVAPAQSFGFLSVK